MNFGDIRVLKSGTQNARKFLASANSRRKTWKFENPENRLHLEIIHGFKGVVEVRHSSKAKKFTFRNIQLAYLRIINDVINNREDFADL